jgi:integrase
MRMNQPPTDGGEYSGPEFRDACGRLATRTPVTISRYRLEAARLIKQSCPDLEADDLGRLSHAIDWYSSNDGAWSSSTIRHHRAALRQAVSDIAVALELPSTEVSGLHEQLAAGPQPKGNRARAVASARKRRSVKMAEVIALVEGLSKSDSHTGRLLAGMVGYGANLGLRPSEFGEADLRGNTLVVKCRKYTNGRGIASHRFLKLVGFDQQAILGLANFLGELRKAERQAGCWQRFHERMAKALTRACKKLRIDPISLYTLRHCAIATAKRYLSIQEVAAFAGHSSGRTAQKSYAKRRAGWRIRAVLVRPTAETVALVRPSVNGSFRPSRTGPP